jgi:surfactin synthase thioesterase subunit
MEPLVADLAGVLGPLCDRPCIFFGHSMGARVAYALARHLAARRDVPLLHLVVSGSSAPHRPSDRELHTLSDDELLEELQRMNGTPPEILQEAEVRQHLLPLLRADLTVSGTYASSVQDGGFDTPDLPEIPIVALGGRDDHIVSESGLRAWADLTRGPFRLRMFPGGHFFLNDRTREIAHELLTLQSREARHVARR